MTDSQQPPDDLGPAVALVGMAGRFPGADDVRGLWANLRAGRCTVSEFGEDELRANGVPESLLADPAYVRAGSVIDGIDLFDAGFFGYTPREAQLLDPQQRLFLETCWHALEDAAVDPGRYDGAVGVVAGSAMSSYLLHNLAAHPAVLETAGEVQIGIANDKDSLATRVAHALDLTGPCYSVQSYCSTSLVSVAAACSALVSGEADVMLAGGVTVAVPHRVGYLYQEAGMSSPDGRCRAFDASAQGTPVGSGVGVVALKRLEDAEADGDRIYAVLRGWAVNNDGADKVGFTAPGVRGQAAVVAEALASAGLGPADIDYVEAHGTGTPLGDAAEISSLQQVFDVDGVQRTLIGSAKSNLGHLDRAAGVTGLIKAALSLHHEEIPPTLHLDRPNPQLARSGERLTPVTELTPWQRGERVRRAGISAFGMGGTNAHVVAEEAEPLIRDGRVEPREHQVLLWSARSEDAAAQATARLGTHLASPGDWDRADTDLGDITHTLQTGRAVFEHRRALVTSGTEDAVRALNGDETHRVLARRDGTTKRPVSLLLAGVGEHYKGMVAGLHAAEPVFADALDEAVSHLVPHLGQNPVAELIAPRDQGADDLARLLGRDTSDPDSALGRTEIAQPAVFAVDFALGKLLEAWGVRPRLLLGYSVGEFAAACLAGALTLPEAAGLVAVRAKLIADLPTGTMAAVPLSATALTARYSPRTRFGVDVAAHNGPTVSVISGPADNVRALCEQLLADGLPCRPLRTTHAFHSTMLRPAAEPLTEWARANLRPKSPRIPYLSNVTGAPVTEQQLADPGYWARHMCSAVRFSDMLKHALADSQDVLLEIGPGQSLGALARNHPDCPPERWPLLVPTLPAEADPTTDEETLAGAVAQLWLAGVELDWDAYTEDRQPRKVSVPDYPFQRELYWIDPPTTVAMGAGRGQGSQGRGTRGRVTGVGGAQAQGGAGKARSGEQREEILVPAWTPAPLTGSASFTPAGPVWVLADGGGVAAAVAEQLGEAVVLVRPGTGYDVTGAAVTVGPAEPGDWERLLADKGTPSLVLHLWGTDPSTAEDPDRALELGFASLCALAPVLGGAGGATRLLTVTDSARAVAPGDIPIPARAAALGACLVIPQEYPSLKVRSVDVALVADGSRAVAEAVLREAAPEAEGRAVAWRGGQRSVLEFKAEESAGVPELTVRQDSVVLVTGGLGDVGQIVARHLGAEGATIVLTGRRPVPDTDPRLRRLADQGVTVEYAVADVTDEDAVRRVMADLTERFGHVDGVVHLAAVTGAELFGPLALLEQASRDAHFGPKLYGTAVLERVLGDIPAGFCLLFSSVSTVLGGIGFAGYAAANSALDAFPYRHAGDNTRWLAVNWDTWAPTAAALDGQEVGATQVEHSLSEERALAALARVMARPVPRTVVSAGELQARVEQWLDQDADDDEELARPAGDRFPRPALAQSFVPPSGARQRRLAEVWEDVLGIDGVGARDNFADLGGTSLMALQLVKRIQKAFSVAVSPVALFEAPTVHTMAELLDRIAGPAEEAAQPQEPAPAPRFRPAAVSEGPEPIAVVGLACRFPGAQGPEQFWANLRDGVESVSRFSAEELRASGVPEELLNHPDYVPAKPVLDDIKGFDANFFGYSARDAVITDPQHRLMLEICWEALDDGGYGAADARGRVGVFAGSNISSYLSSYLMSGAIEGEADIYASVIGNDKDSLATGVSYKLGLTGPSLSVQTFCSTALVATHLACQSLRSGECELALAGGVAIHVPDRVGHLYQPGGMETRDGHVRTFDAGASGTLFGDGAGVVLLKRLSDALADGDHVYAVIRGSAVNNDGSLKVGYTAPSVVGQARVISDALAVAGVDPADVGYVEAHGTATELGDPIEVAALAKAFGPGPVRQSTPIGSVKTNIGHLAAAAGASGLIKTVLSVSHGQLPPSLNFERPNPEIDFASTPFYVNTELADWTPPSGKRRIAGVNSLGMGGTNVHVVVEEAPEPVRAQGGTGRRYEVVPLSGRTAEAADAAVQRLREHLAQRTELPLTDVAFTAQTGRAVFEHRRTLVVRADVGSDTGAGPDGPDLSGPVLGRAEPLVDRPAAFLIAGVGEQYPGMVRELYAREPEFKAAVDECGDVLRYLLDTDVVALLTGPRPEADDDPFAAMIRAREGKPADDSPLTRTEIAQPAVFVAEYALARLLVSWGVKPSLMLGYSLGEYVAACLSGVLTLPDALRLVAFRAQLIARLPRGSMLAVAQTPDRLTDLTAAGLEVAALNGPEVTVVGGTAEAVDAYAAKLEKAGVAHRKLSTTHAFHTSMLEPARAELTAWARANLRPAEPSWPYVSCLTGQPVTAELVADPEYWGRHMVSPVRFADGLAQLLADPDLALLEIGAGQSLGAMARSHPECPPARGPLILATLPNAADPTPDDRTLADALAGLWLAGVRVDWTAHHAGRAPRRVPLPSYPFERTDYWIVPDGNALPAARQLPNSPVPEALPLLPEEEWVHAQVWRQTAPRTGSLPAARWLLLADDDDETDATNSLADALKELLEAAGGTVTAVRPQDVTPADPTAFRTLLKQLKEGPGLPERIVHLWTLRPEEPPNPEAASLTRGIHTLVTLTRAMSDAGATKWSLDVVTSGTASVTGAETIHPELATLLGPVRVIPLEYPDVTCRLIDLDAAERPRPATLAAELGDGAHAPLVALRRGRRWLPDYESVPAGPSAEVLREEGVYLVTGGLGGIGLAMAERLARDVRARLVLVGRTGLPPRDTWDAVLTDPATSDEVRRRLTGVRKIEEYGGQVTVVTGDLAAPGTAARAVAEAHTHYGALHGVLHAAGLPGVGLMQFKTEAEMAKVMAPKVAGTQALRVALGGSGIDFLALFSSITSATGGGPGQLDYCAANAYLDAHAHAAAQLPDAPRTVAIGWGEWQWNAWEAGLAGYDPEVREYFRETRRKFGIGFDEGWRALKRVLALDEPHLVVNTQDFAAMAKGATQFNVEAIGKARDTWLEGARHPRPDLLNAYVAPNGETETAIAEVWAQMLGLDQVGATDSFFALGGNSLTGMEVMARIRRRLGVEDLPPHVLYEAPTVGALARHVTGSTEQDSSADELERGKQRRSGLKRARKNRKTAGE